MNLNVLSTASILFLITTFILITSVHLFLGLLFCGIVASIGCAYIGRDLNGTAGTVHKVIFTCLLIGWSLFLLYIGLIFTSFSHSGWASDKPDEKPIWFGVMIGIMTMVAGVVIMFLPFIIFFKHQSSRRVERTVSIHADFVVLSSPQETTPTMVLFDDEKTEEVV